MSEEAPAPVKRHDRVSMEGMIANGTNQAKIRMEDGFFFIWLLLWGGFSCCSLVFSSY